MNPDPDKDEIKISHDIPETIQSNPTRTGEQAIKDFEETIDRDIDKPTPVAQQAGRKTDLKRGRLN